MRLLFSKLRQKAEKPSLVLIAFRKETRQKMKHVLTQLLKSQRKFKVDKAGLSFNAIEAELELSEVKKALPLTCRSMSLSPTAIIDVPSVEDVALEPSVEDVPQLEPSQSRKWGGGRKGNENIFFIHYCCFYLFFSKKFVLKYIIFTKECNLMR